MGKIKLALVLVLLLISAAMTVTGSMALFTGNSVNRSNSFMAGTVKVTAWEYDECGFLGDKGKMTPGKSDDRTVILNNTGSLDQWVGLQFKLSGSLFSLPHPPQVRYTVELYTQDFGSQFQTATHSGAGDGGKDGSKDEDMRSHCRNSNKDRQDAIKDKKQVTPTPYRTINRDWFAASDTGVMTPFQLPVGYYAVVKYETQLPQRSSRDNQGKNGSLSLQVHAVQVRNNDSPAGPSSWNPM